MGRWEADVGSRGSGSPVATPGETRTLAPRAGLPIFFVLLRFFFVFCFLF